MVETGGTGTVSSIGDVSGPGADAAKAREQPKGAEEWFELLLDGQEQPTKIPLSKLKDEKLLEKLNPDIGKLRSEAHRRMTEAEKRGKALQAKEAELAPLAEVAKLIERVKQEPKAYRQLARDLGVSKDELDAWHEEEFAPRLLRMIEEKEAEMKGPEAKKALDEARELDRLRRENEDLKKKTEDEQKQKESAFEAEVHRGVSNFMKDSLELLKFPELKWLAAREMTSILHRWNDTDHDGSKEELLLEALKRVDRNMSVVRRAALSEDELTRADEELKKRKGKPKNIHPAVEGQNREKPKPRADSGRESDAPKGHIPAALAFFQKYTGPGQGR